MRTPRVATCCVAGVLALALSAAAPLAAQDAVQSDLTLLHCVSTVPAPPDRRPVGPSGGTLETPSGHRLEIPAGALAADHQLEMSELGNGVVGVHITTGADAVAFNGPVRLTLAYRRCAPDTRIASPVIVRVEEDGTLSELPSLHDDRIRAITTILTGNSEYALAVPRR